MPALLNAKHEHFCQLIAGGLSATKAYINAGYSAAGASTSASRLLQNAEVRARASELKAAVSSTAIERIAVDRAWVLATLKRNAERAEDRGDGSTVNRACELIGKELGMFRERQEISGSDGGPLDSTITVTFVRPQAEPEAAA